jgi:hypothetical protein
MAANVCINNHLLHLARDPVFLQVKKIAYDFPLEDGSPFQPSHEILVANVPLFVPVP